MNRQTATQVHRIFVAFLGTLLFCALAGAQAVIDVPVGEGFGHPVSQGDSAPLDNVDSASPGTVTESETVPEVQPQPKSKVRASRRQTTARPTGLPGSIPTGEIQPMRPNLMALGVSAEGDLHLSTEGEPTPPAPTDKPSDIAIHVVDWELSEIVSSLMTQTGINIVLASPNNPRITVKLDKMPIREAIRVIASIANMNVVQLKSGGFVVATSEVLQAAFPTEFNQQIVAAAKPAPESEKPVVKALEIVETYDVKNVKPSELSEALTAIFQVDGLVVRVGPGKLLPSAIGESNGADPSGSPTGPSNSAPSTSTGRTLVIRGERSAVAAALKLAGQLDVKQPQVAIRVQIHDISNDALRDLGVSWQDSTGVRLTENNSNRSDINFGSFNRNPISFLATLRHLEKTNHAKILAQPNISVLDQEPGYILIGDRINYPVVTSLNGSGQPVFDVREERVGIYLQVSATVNDPTRVTLNLYPQVSTISGFLEVPGQGSYPQISTREAKTSIRVKSGETVVIAGLLRDEEIKSIERVPLLSQIPLFGELFTRRKTTKNQSQVIISITPQVIESES